MKHSVASGLPVLLIGAAIVAEASGYPIGTVTRMGPGYLPVACGIMLMVLGALAIAFEREPLDAVSGRSAVRPLAAVFGGLLAWAIVAPRFGLVPATFALVAVVSFAQPRPSAAATLATAAFLSAFGVVVFLMGLNIRLSAFRF